MSDSIIRDEASPHLRAARTNIAAEARGVEEGHLCRWDPAARLFVVKSDSGGLDYQLTVRAAVMAAPGDPEGADALLVVSCTPCPTSSRQRPSGIMGCKHRTRVARRLERLGFARFDGARWRVKRPLIELAYVLAEEAEPDDVCTECGAARVDLMTPSRYDQATRDLCGRCSVLADDADDYEPGE